MDLLLALIALLVVFACTWAWSQALPRLRSAEGLLPRERRRPVPWGLLDLASLVGLLVVFQLGAATALRVLWGLDLARDVEQLGPRPRAAILLVSSLGSLVAAAVSVFLLRFRVRASWADLGLVAGKFSRDLRLGLLAFLMLAPPVYLVQIILVQWIPSQHPLIEMLQEHPDPWFFVLGGFAAVIVAPVVEEYIFRVLLQGWLEKVAVFRGPTSELLVGRWFADTEQPAPAATDEPLPFWPVLVSAAVFALMHFGHGPDPIPLFVLALGLGYVYQRTHRLLPVILVHALLNAVSLAGLWFQTYYSG